MSDRPMPLTVACDPKRVTRPTLFPNNPDTYYNHNTVNNLGPSLRCDTLFRFQGKGVNVGCNKVFCLRLGSDPNIYFWRTLNRFTKPNSVLLNKIITGFSHSATYTPVISRISMLHFLFSPSWRYVWRPYSLKHTIKTVCRMV